MKRSSLTPYLLSASLGAGLVLLWVAVTDHLVWNGSPSMPRGWYYRVQPGVLVGGDIVEFHAPASWLDHLSAHEAIQRGHVTLLKQIRATPGEVACWEIADQSVCRRLTEREIFVLGQHDRSLDSRRVGPIDTRIVSWRLIPLWTWVGRK